MKYETMTKKKKPGLYVGGQKITDLVSCEMELTPDGWKVISKQNIFQRPWSWLKMKTIVMRFKIPPQQLGIIESEFKEYELNVWKTDEQKLQDALDAEDYELAAEIRDKIKARL